MGSMLWEPLGGRSKDPRESGVPSVLPVGQGHIEFRCASCGEATCAAMSSGDETMMTHRTHPDTAPPVQREMGLARRAPKQRIRTAPRKAGPSGPRPLRRALSTARMVAGSIVAGLQRAPADPRLGEIAPQGPRLAWAILMGFWLGSCAVTTSPADERFMIEGLQDRVGLAKAIGATDALRQRAFDDLPAIERIRDLGFDSFIHDFMGEDLLRDFGVEIVDLVPWGASDQSDVYGSGFLDAGLPSRGSLVGFQPSTVVYRYDYIGGGGRTGRAVQTATTVDPEGRIEETVVITWDDGGATVHKYSHNEEGRVSEYFIDDYDENGELIRSERVATPQSGGDSGEGSGGEGDSGGDSGTDDAGDDPGDDSGDDPGDDVDGFQPADGEGTYCPLVLQYCRRQLEEAEEGNDPDRLRLGAIRINPPDDAPPPEGPRFRFDPEDFVINPSPDDAGRDRDRPVTRVEIFIPVWVNPPGPDDSRR